MIHRRLERLVLVSIFVASAALAAALTHAEDAASARGAEASARGAEALAPFKQALKQALTEGLAAGPVDAVTACNVRAPAIADAHSTGGVRVGRASHRLRNPDNAPPDWVRPILDAYLADEASRAPRTVALDGGREGYVEPIVLQPLCVTCHGEALAPDVAARIEALYPDDAATGFAVGDLRGVWWVELPPAS